MKSADKFIEQTRKEIDRLTAEREAARIQIGNLKSYLRAHRVSASRRPASYPARPIDLGPRLSPSVGSMVTPPIVDGRSPGGSSLKDLICGYFNAAPLDASPVSAAKVAKAINRPLPSVTSIMSKLKRRGVLTNITGLWSLTRPHGLGGA